MLDFEKLPDCKPNKNFENEVDENLHFFCCNIIHIPLYVYIMGYDHDFIKRLLLTYDVKQKNIKRIINALNYCNSQKNNANIDFKRLLNIYDVRLLNKIFSPRIYVKKAF